MPGVLAALGYEPFAYLRGRLLNPTAVLLWALCQTDLPSRVVEVLPWLALRFPDLNRQWLVERAKVHDVQNRLAYVVTLASELAVGDAAARLQELVLELEPSRLAREDTALLPQPSPLRLGHGVVADASIPSGRCGWSRPQSGGRGRRLPEEERREGIGPEPLPAGGVHA